MDEWEPSQRHKRSFAEMSQQATLSPSPIIFREPAISSLSSNHHHFAPATTSEFRRRTSHPHNFLSRASEEMPDRSQSQQRPRLEHRASQTIIDLTDDPEDRPAPVRSRGQSGAAHAHRPPQLGRSDALELVDFVDLTEEEPPSPEVQFTHARELPQPAAAPEAQRNGPIQFPQDLNHLRLPPIRNNPAPLDRGPNRNMFRALAGGFAGGFANVNRIFLGGGPQHQPHPHFVFDLEEHPPPMQPMPGRMDYRQPAFPNRQERNMKPDHKPPTAARSGFTRSPTEKDTVICPSCELELVHRKDIEEPVVKKSGKAPTKKEREEHPFWVVRECGHVFCNTCYQHRSNPSKSPINTSFEEKKSGGKGTKKTVICTVEDCESDVTNKDKWVGVFL